MNIIENHKKILKSKIARMEKLNKMQRKTTQLEKELERHKVKVAELYNSLKSDLQIVRKQDA